VSTGFRHRLLLTFSVLGLVTAACTGSSGRQTSPAPSAGHGGAPFPIPPIPDGTYTATISLRDAEASPNAHIINLATQLAGRYELTLRGGTYTINLDGRNSVPTPVAIRTGGEGAYAQYGFWLFLGVPPIGRGVYTGDSATVAFRSRGGACFQSGASSTLTTGVYRWTFQGDSLTLQAVDSGSVTPGSSQFAGGEGCLGRGFVLTSHPWTKEG
jgi:hypothetical protein